MEGYEAPSKARSRDRVLSDRELTIIYRSAGELGWPFGTIVQLLILTGQRRNEITSLRETWVDQSDIKLITLPSEIVKNSQEHTILLGPMAETILESTPVLNGFYFKARGTEDRSYMGWSKGKRALDELIQGDAEKSSIARWRFTICAEPSQLGSHASACRSTSTISSSIIGSAAGGT